MSELSECGLERSGVYILISPQNCEKGLSLLFCTSVHFEILFSFTFTVNPTKDRTIPIIIHKLFSVRRYLY